MARLYPLLARFGLFVPKSNPAADAFDLRLTRLGTREARMRPLGLTFKSRSTHPEAAALS